MPAGRRGGHRVLCARPPSVRKALGGAPLAVAEEGSKDSHEAELGSEGGERQQRREGRGRRREQRCDQHRGEGFAAAVPREALDGAAEGLDQRIGSRQELVGGLLALFGRGQKLLDGEPELAHGPAGRCGGRGRWTLESGGGLRGFGQWHGQDSLQGGTARERWSSVLRGRWLLG